MTGELPAAAPAPPVPADQGSGGPLHVRAADGFRAFAILGVIADHCLYAAGRPILHFAFLRNIILGGYVCVDFFFVLSGFVLFLPVAQRGTLGDRRSYALRRIARILPAYYVALVVTQLLAAYLVHQPVNYPMFSRTGVAGLLLHATFLNHSLGLGLGYQEGFGINGAVWTLSIEAVFYLVLPFVASWYARRPFLGLALAEAGAVAWRVIADHGWYPWASAVRLPPATYRTVVVTQFPAYAAHFALGMTAAWVFIQIRRRRIVVPAWVLVAVQAVALVAIVHAMAAGGARDLAGTSGPLDHWTTTTPTTVWFTLLLVATALAPRWAQRPVDNPLTTGLSKISYGFYLYHLLFIGFALETLHWLPDATTNDFVRLFMLAASGAIVLGTASYLLVERPAIRWARRQTRARAARLALPAPVRAATPAAGLSGPAA